MKNLQQVDESNCMGEQQVQRQKVGEKKIPFTVEPLESELQSVPIQRAILLRIADPSWLTSLLVHVALLLILAWYILPSVRKMPMVFLGETISEEEVDEFEFDLIQFPDSELQLDPELESAEMDPLDALDDLSVEANFFPQAIEAQDIFASQLVEHGATREIVGPTESGAAELSTDQKLASGIQDQVTQAGGKNGEVQFSLVWKTITDLDLHVVAPSGERICYLNRRSRCRGDLDVDRNAKETTRSPVENIRWLKGQPESGHYTVIVHMYRLRDRRTAVKYDLMAKTGDDLDLQKDQEITIDDRLQVYRYIYFSPAVPESRRAAARERLQQLQIEEEKKASALLAVVQPGSPQENMLLSNIVRHYPHTDAAIEALKRMSGQATK